MHTSPKLFRLCLWAFTLFATSFPIFKGEAQEASSERGNLVVKLRTSAPGIERHFNVYMDANICGHPIKINPVTKGSKGELMDTLIWLEGNTLKKETYSAQAPSEIKIEKCRFSSSFVFTGLGQPLIVTSTDAINYDLNFVTSDKKHISRSLPPNLKNVSVEFEKTGIVEISCTLHPWMKAFAVVPTHSYFAVTDKMGEVRFNSVPAGSYKLHLWHGTLGKKVYATEIEITRGVKSLELEWEDI